MILAIRSVVWILHRCVDRGTQMAEPWTAALLRDVRKRLEEAVAADEECQREIISSLYTDVAGKVSQEARARLGDEWAGENPLYFYQIISSLLQVERAHARSLVSLLQSLWGNQHAAAVYALLLHRYVLTIPANVGLEGEYALDGLHRLCNVTAASCTRLFWYDLMHLSERFKPLFRSVAHFTASAQLVEALPENARKELFACVLQFLPYCETDGGVAEQLSHFRLLHVPSDEVLDQITVQINSIRSEEPLALFLRRLKSLNRTFVLDSARLRSVLLFQRAIYGLTTPGGPVYPPRSVRHAAIEALDALFPRGRRFRNGVNLFFRLWRPKYVPASLSNYVVSNARRTRDFFRRRNNYKGDKSADSTAR